MEFCHYLMQHLEKHKAIQPQDIVKFCYQAAYGAEHLRTEYLFADIEAVRNYFYSEYDSIMAKEGELYEELSTDICRVHFAAWKASNLPIEWLFNMFVHSTSVSHGSKELFLEYLQKAEEIILRFEGVFTPDEWRKYLMSYKEFGMPAVHHSESFRENEKPSYRIINKQFLRVLPILQQAALLSKKKSAKVIAIDGRAASGKSTMTELLRIVLDAGVIHMDDFFLPPALRKEERLLEPGGNVHYERFCQEVLPSVVHEEGFSYKIFDCSRMELQGERKVDASSWRIVEGSYSHHPKFGDYADLKIFSDVDAEEQIRRIDERNGEKMKEKFCGVWIPMEEIYFEKCRIKELSNLVV